MSSTNVIFNRKSFIPFNPNATYKITCTLRADTSTFAYAPNVTLKVGIIGSRNATEPVLDSDLILQSQSLYGVSGGISSNISSYGFWHCFNGTLNTACIASNLYYTLTGYTSNGGIYANMGTTAVGTLQNPGKVFYSITVGQVTTNFITPIIFVYNSGAQAVKIAFDSLMIEEVTNSMSAAGLVTGTIASQVITVGAGKVIIDGPNTAIRIRNNADTLDQITIGKTGTSAAGIIIKNAAGTEVFKVDDTGASISNITMGAAGALTWGTNALDSVTTAGGKTIGQALTSMNASGIYTGTLTAQQINSQLITSAAISGATIGADKIATGNLAAALNLTGAGKLNTSNYVLDNTGCIINADGTFQFNQNTNNFLRYTAGKFYLGAGKPTYASVSPGVYISNTSGEYFSMGNATNYLKYDGTTLSLSGNIDMSRSAVGQTTNLFRDFNASATNIYYSISAAASRTVELPSKVPGASVLRATRIGSGDGYILYGDMYLVAGKYYTISFWYKASVSDTISSTFGWPQQHGGSGATYNLQNGTTNLSGVMPTTWTFYYSTILAGVSNSYAHLVLRPLNTIGGGYIDYTGIKVEEGQVASQWTPAPEDLAMSGFAKANMTLNPILTGGTGGITLGNDGFILAGSKTNTGAGNGLLYGKTSSGDCLFNVGKGAHGDFASGPHMSWNSAANAGAGELEIIGTITASTMQSASGIGTGVPGMKITPDGMIVHDGTAIRVKIGNLLNL